jgi:uncharacterized protein
MLSLFTLTFAILLIVVLIMAVGVIFNRRAIKGSCGGIAGGECCGKNNCQRN